MRVDLAEVAAATARPRVRTVILRTGRFRAAAAAQDRGRSGTSARVTDQGALR